MCLPMSSGMLLCSFATLRWKRDSQLKVCFSLLLFTTNFGTYYYFASQGAFRLQPCQSLNFLQLTFFLYLIAWVFFLFFAFFSWVILYFYIVGDIPSLEFLYLLSYPPNNISSFFSARIFGFWTICILFATNFIWCLGSADSLRVEGLLELVDKKTVGSRLPSPIFSSDHIALMASFRLIPPSGWRPNPPPLPLNPWQTGSSKQPLGGSYFR